MDVLVIAVLGAGCLVLLVVGAVDAVRGRRAKVIGAAEPPSGPTGPNRIVLVRHGETEWSRAGKHTGRTDVALTDVGEAQAAALQPVLAGWTFDAVLVSPLTRARDTLERLDRSEPVTVLDDLREWDYGDDEGRTTAEIRVDRPDWSVWEDGPANGERVEDVAARADRVLRHLRATDGDALVVAHGHVLRIFAARWLALSPHAGRLLALDPATVSVLDHEREQRVLRQWNLSPRPAPGDDGR